MHTAIYLAICVLLLIYFVHRVNALKCLKNHRRCCHEQFKEEVKKATPLPLDERMMRNINFGIKFGIGSEGLQKGHLRMEKDHAQRR